MKISWAGMMIAWGALAGEANLNAQTTYEPYAFITIAGVAGSLGSSDGSGLAARFNAPQSIAVASNGNVYISDTGNNAIRRIAPDGAVSTLAGSAGSTGSADGTGSTARFDLPQGVAVDAAGNVYVGDSANDTIRKITPAGVVTTLAGSAHQVGSADGTGATARFFYPVGVTVDPSGNVYVVDNGNSTIRKVTPAGVVTTLAGLAGNTGSMDGLGSAARFSFPMRAAYNNASGFLFVADAGNNTIRKVSAAGLVTTIAGSPGVAGSNDGTGSAALFDGPRGVAVDASGNVYVAASNSHTIRKIGPTAVVTTLAGVPGTSGSTDGVGSNVRFNSPYSVAANAVGNLYVTDTVNHTIRLGVPADHALSLNIVTLSNGRKLLSGQTFPNASVEILATTDIAGGFLPLATVAADANGLFQYEDVASIKRFYRASVSGS